MPLRFVCLVFIFALIATGCGKKETPKIALFPVSGKITVKGKAPERAQLTFHPSTPVKDPGNRVVVPTATVAADGTFKAGFYTSDDGAPPGEFTITVVWPTYKIEQGEEIAGPDRLNGRYSHPNESTLKVTITEGPNGLKPIDLK